MTGTMIVKLVIEDVPYGKAAARYEELKNHVRDAPGVRYIKIISWYAGEGDSENGQSE